MLFNSQGELNAMSKEDALFQLAKIAQLLQENQPSNLSVVNSSGLSEDEQNELVTKAIYTQEGKLALAQAMANPVRP